MSRRIAILLFFASISALAAVPKPPPQSKDPATPLALTDGRVLWVRGPVIEDAMVYFYDASGLNRAKISADQVDWAQTEKRTAAHAERIAKTGEEVRYLKITGDPEQAAAMALSVKMAQERNYQEAMKIPLKTESEKHTGDDELQLQALEEAQAKCDAIAVPVGPNTSPERMMWIQSMIQAKCDRLRAEAMRRTE